jgi:hypothetical protein
VTRTRAAGTSIPRPSGKRTSRHARGDVDPGTTRHLIVYITEASASGAGSTCHLASRTPYFDNDMNAGKPAFTKTTSGTSAKRSLDFTDNANLTNPQGYTLECQLKPGATINSLRFGAF